MKEKESNKKNTHDSLTCFFSAQLLWSMLDDLQMELALGKCLIDGTFGST